MRVEAGKRSLGTHVGRSQTFWADCGVGGREGGKEGGGNRVGGCKRGCRCCRSCCVVPLLRRNLAPDVCVNVLAETQTSVIRQVPAVAGESERGAHHLRRFRVHPSRLASKLQPVHFVRSQRGPPMVMGLGFSAALFSPWYLILTSK